METEIRVVFFGGKIDSIEITEKKSIQVRSAEAGLRALLNPILKTGQKQCD